MRWSVAAGVGDDRSDVAQPFPAGPSPREGVGHVTMGIVLHLDRGTFRQRTHKFSNH